MLIVSIWFNNDTKPQNVSNSTVLIIKTKISNRVTKPWCSVLFFSCISFSVKEEINFHSFPVYRHQCKSMIACIGCSFSLYHFADASVNRSTTPGDLWNIYIYFLLKNSFLLCPISQISLNFHKDMNTLTLLSCFPINPFQPCLQWFNMNENEMNEN